jgi:hypothetical protein
MLAEGRMEDDGLASILLPVAVSLLNVSYCVCPVLLTR